MEGETGAEQAKDVFGSVKDSVYSNEYYGIHFAFDSSWEYKIAEDFQDVPEDRVNLPYDEEYKVFWAKRGDGMVQFDLSVERMDEDTMEEFATLGEEGFIDYMVDVVERRSDEISNEEATFKSVEKVKMDFCGQEKWAVKIVFDYSAEVITQYQIFYIDTEYVADFVCTFSGEKTEKDFLAMFY